MTRAVQVNDAAEPGSYSLIPFDTLMAPVVARWARTPLELFWLAPKTPAPLTAAKVTEWVRRDDCPMMFCCNGRTEPIGYLELNPMPQQAHHLWMGHCVLAPEHRGSGLGRIMVRLMLDQAFYQRGARRVSLVVFPENLSAVHCYRRAGFVDAGEQVKYFSTTGRQHLMIRMSLDREMYRSMKDGR